MISPKTLARLMCPNCFALQRPGPLLRTMKGEDNWVACVECSECHLSLRVQSGDGLVFAVLVSVGAIAALLITGVGQHAGAFSISDFEQAAFIKAALRLVAYLFIIFWIVVPLSSRILTVEQTQ